MTSFVLPAFARPSFVAKKKTVDSVMEAFTKTIADLEQVKTAETEEALRLREDAAHLMTRAAVAEAEANRAAILTQRLNGLVSV